MVSSVGYACQACGKCYIPDEIFFNDTRLIVKKVGSSPKSGESEINQKG
jgi:hypothetical protein